MAVRRPIAFPFSALVPEAAGARGFPRISLPDGGIGDVAFKSSGSFSGHGAGLIHERRDFQHFGGPNAPGTVDWLVTADQKTKMMPKKITKLTRDQIDRFGEWTDHWIKIGLSTEPANFDKATEAALRGYQLANLKRPMIILRMSSPYGAVLGGVLAWAMLRQMKGDQVWAQVRDQVRDQVGAQVWAQVRDQVWDQVGAQVWAQVRDQVWDQVRDQVLDQVGAQVRDQVRDQVWDQVGDQVGAQVGAQVRDQVWDQVGAQVGAQVRDQVWDQVGAQVWAQVGAQVGAQVRDQVWDQVRDQVWDQVGDQVGAQVGAQVRDQVWDQVGAQVGAQVRDQVWDQVGAQVWAQVGAQVRDQVWDQVRDQVLDQVLDQVGAQVWAQVWDQVLDQIGDHLRDAPNNSLYAQHDAGFGAWVTFFRDVCGWENETVQKFEVAETLIKSCGWTWWHENVLTISDRPNLISRDERGQLHSEVGPSISYRDGWVLHHWHGTYVPAHWIERRATLDPAEVLKAQNVEQRAAGAAIVGWPKMVTKLKRKIIDGDPSSDMGALIELTLPGLREPGRFLQAVCPRNGTIVEGVPRVSDIDGLPIDTVIAAQAWRVGDPQSEYVHPPKRT